MIHEHVFYWTENGHVAFSGQCVTCDYYCNWEEFKELANV